MYLDTGEIAIGIIQNMVKTIAATAPIVFVVFGGGLYKTLLVRLFSDSCMVKEC